LSIYSTDISSHGWAAYYSSNGSKFSDISNVAAAASLLQMALKLAAACSMAAMINASVLHARTAVAWMRNKGGAGSIY